MLDEYGFEVMQWEWKAGKFEVVSKFFLSLSEGLLFLGTL